MYTKEEYRELLRVEVYGTKKLGLLARYDRRHRNPSTNAVYLMRKMQYYAGRGWLGRIISRRAQIKLVRRYNIFVGKNTIIGKGISFPHPTGIIIGQTVQIGERCKIFQGVTVGSRNNGDWKQGLQPHIGDDCTLFSGCAVIGAVTLGDKTIVGANAVMRCDSEPSSVWAGIPAREIKRGQV